jgi:hypothetical protein
MTVTRDDVAAYLDSQFSALAASAGQDSDPLTGYEPDINLAYRKLGVARADLATATLEDSQEDAATTLAEYYALRRIWRQLGDRINFSADGATFNHQYMVANVKALVDDAQKRCASLGYDVTGEAWSIGYLNQDWLEPEVTW